MRGCCRGRGRRRGRCEGGNCERDCASVISRGGTQAKGRSKDPIIVGGCQDTRELRCTAFPGDIVSVAGRQRALIIGDTNGEAIQNATGASSHGACYGAASWSIGANLKVLFQGRRQRCTLSLACWDARETRISVAGTAVARDHNRAAAVDPLGAIIVGTFAAGEGKAARE